MLETFGKFGVIFLAYTVLPIFGILILIPIGILRVTSLLSAKLCRPDLKRALDPESGLTCYDDFYGEPKHTVVGVLYTSTPMERKAVIQRMQEIVQDGNFSELSLKLTYWMGQYYWGDCLDFNLENHVTTSDNVVNYEDLQQEKNKLYRKAFLKHQPLWEIVLLPNFKRDDQNENEHGGESAFILRIHHVLGDGLAFVALLDGISGKVIKRPYRDWKSKLGEWFPSVSPKYQYRLVLGFLKDLNTNSWIRPKCEWSDTVYNHEACIEFASVKQAAKNLKATVTETLAVAVTQAVAAELEKPFPETISALYVLPKPHHPGTLTNHAYLSTLLLPVGVKERSGILTGVRTDLKLKRKSAPLMNVSLRLAGILLQAFPGQKGGQLPLSTRFGSLGTLCFSTAALPPEPWKLFGVTVTGVCISIDVAYHIPVMIVMAGYAGKLHVSLRGRSDVMGDPGRPKIIMDRILREIDEIANTEKV